MLNSKLTSPELVANLEKSDKGKLLDTIDVINTELSYSQDGEGFAKIPIRQDRKILGRLHHIFNIKNNRIPLVKTVDGVRVITLLFALSKMKVLYGTL